MKKKPNFPVLAGIFLIFFSCTLVFVHQFRIHAGLTRSAQLAAKLEPMIPQRSEGYLGIYSEPEMPVLELEGRDWCGLLEIPAYGLTLPIQGVWDPGSLPSAPCRFWGSVYDGTMILGGADQEGQFAFCSRTNPGDFVILTDMLGNEFTYQVARV